MTLVAFFMLTRLIYLLEACAHVVYVRISVAQQNPLYYAEVSTKANLEPVTVMDVRDAAGIAFMPAIVWEIKPAHYRYMNKQNRTTHTFLPDCHTYQGEILGVDTKICLEWTRFSILDRGALREWKGHHARV